MTPIAFALTHAGGAMTLLSLLACALVGMAFTHSIGVTYKSQEGTITNTTESFTGDREDGIDTTVPPATTDQVEALSITVAKITSCCLYSAVALTVKTYAAGVLKQTIALAAGKQLTWNSSSTFANPFTNDFDTIKVTNADVSKSTNFKARFLLTD